MRRILLACLASTLLAGGLSAADLRTFDDAPLRAVQFVDGNEGWAVGDEGVIWHTIDGGRTWERQSSGVRSSLRSVCFLTPYMGWIAGREELPNGNGSVGVLLLTRDGGLKWQRVLLNALPGLNCVRFRDDKVGFVAGDGSDQYPSGVFETSDGGRTWQPVPGPRASTWLAADFADGQNGALAGAWNRLATFRRDSVHQVDVDSLGSRNLRGLQLQGKRGIAVGDGGLVLLSDDSGTTWGICDLKLPTEVMACCDFHAVRCVDKEVWVVGRPGSVVLHSKDQGETWEWQRTGQPLPLHGVYFRDAVHGWAVGELGAILATADGGKTWIVQRRGGQRAAVLLLQGREMTPLDVVAHLGGEDGYLTGAVRVVAPDSTTASLNRAADAERYSAALRMAGGAAGEMLWQFPLPEHQANSEPPELLKAWDKAHAGRASQDLLQQLVLCIRMWRPNVLLIDQPGQKNGETAADSLVAEATVEAYKQAGDPKAFPEQVDQLGLKPWTPAKLYALCEDSSQAHLSLDTGEITARLQESACEFATPALALLTDTASALPGQRHYRLVASTLDGAAKHCEIMQGIDLAFGGEARRDLKPAEELTAVTRKLLAARRNLVALAETPDKGLTDPNKIVSLIGPTLEGLPDSQGAATTFALANQFARNGQWVLARETFLLLAERYPAHPLAAEAYRWLIRHNASSEARRRHELGQFVVLSTVEYQATQIPADPKTPQKKGPGSIVSQPEVNVVTKQSRQVYFLTDSAETGRWYESSIQFESRLATFGALFVNDPSVQFCVQSARRNLGDFETPKKWYTQFVAKQPPGPWRDAAQAELWLLTRSGAPPKPMAACRQTETRPLLDGKFDDACWQGATPLKLQNAAGDTVKEYPTEVRFSYDKEYLYVALECRHPADKYVELVKRRQRDTDLRPYDHVSLLLDLDRDYQTYFRLEIDQRGCVREDCWGDVTWNPRWFVAAESNPDGWRAEVAIPMTELTGDTVTAGKAWACNVVRTLPGRGVQAWSLPAEVSPRPEGMGLLIFLATDKHR